MPTRKPAEVRRHGSLHRAVPTRNGRMRSAIATLDKVLDVDTNLLLLGESGVGKDFVARNIHRLGNRAPGPFTTIDCATIPAGLFEAEIFGHEKGAFTDARDARRGKLEAGAGGVVYLDEVGVLDLAAQAKLLRVLDERSYTRIGGGTVRDLDIRIISSSNLDLAKAVDEGAFRPDLFYRLNVVCVEIPPLRERREDILPYARKMARTASRRYGKSIRSISEGAESILRGHSWPGNLRELMSVIDGAVLSEDSEELTESSLPREGLRSTRAIVGIGVTEQWSLAELEKHYLKAVIDACGGNYSGAARVLGISRKSLLEKRRRYRLDS